MQSHSATSSFLFTSSVLGLFCMGGLHSLQADAPSSATTSQKEPYDADLFNKDKKVYFINAEFLYWLVNEGAVDYAVKMNQDAWSTTQNTYAIGNYQNATFDWTPGFRINFGYFNAPHYWDCFLQYTYVPASGNNHVSAPDEGGEYLNGTWAQPDVNSAVVPTPLRNAKTHIALQYNVLDFLFSRRFQTNEHLRINVFGGVTSAIIFQKLKVAYEDTAGQHAHVNNRWRFEGAGLRVGAKLDWYLGCDLYLTGVTSTGILSGWYKNTAYEKTDAVIVNTDNRRPILNTGFHDRRLTYTAQFSTGFAWEKRFKCVRTELFAGYEMAIWTNLQEVYRSAFAPATAAKETFINSSNISLQGLTVRFNIDM